MSKYAVERNRDAAFFEDWSEWANLGGHPSHNTYPIGKRRANMPAYHCTLLSRSKFMGGAAFELSLPQNRRVIEIIRSIEGVRQYPQSRPYVEIWMVPVAQWQALRAALPSVRSALDRSGQ